MKKILIIITIIIAGAVFRAEAQYGFGTNAPDPQAIIDMQGSGKGLLIPSVALSATDNPSPFTMPVATSMLVYNTASAGTPGVEVTPGFYYWIGTLWKRLVADGEVTVPAITGNLTSTTLAVAGGNASIANDVTINIADNTVDLVKLKRDVALDKGKVLTVDASGNPVWTPGMKWFYMPGIPISTTTPGATSMNLYTAYTSQFAAPIASSGAPATIQVVPAATDLYYYVTGYDTNVFSGISIDANGVMSYTVSTNPATDCSFINVVFVIK